MLKPKLSFMGPGCSGCANCVICGACGIEPGVNMYGLSGMVAVYFVFFRP